MLFIYIKIYTPLIPKELKATYKLIHNVTYSKLEIPLNWEPFQGKFAPVRYWIGWASILINLTKFGSNHSNKSDKNTKNIEF